VTPSPPWLDRSDGCPTACRVPADGLRLSLPGDLPRGARRRLPPHSPPRWLQSETASLDTAGAPDDLFFPPRRGVVCQERLHGKRSEQEFVAQSVGACSESWNSLELGGQRKRLRAIATCNRVACWRNLAAESVSSLATRASSYPSALQTPRRPRTRRCRSASQSCGSHSQLGASTPPLDLVHCPDSPGNNRILRHSSSAATHG
jgi:hypothetical protein